MDNLTHTLFGATFFVFTDYCRPSLRLAAIMKIPTIVVFTHAVPPRYRAAADVRGSISIGYLDGAARPALFQH